MKNIVGEARIDTTTFKAHSVRGSSSTAAAEKEVAVGEILRVAYWSRDCTTAPSMQAFMVSHCLFIMIYDSITLRLLSPLHYIML